MLSPIDVAIAEMAKDIKYIIKRLDEGTARFEIIEAQLAEHEKQLQRLNTGLAIAAFIIPLIVAYLIGVIK